MYGDLTPGDDTHDNVIRMYGDYFKKRFRSLPKELEQSTEEKYKIWEMTSDIVQVCACVTYRFIASIIDCNTTTLYTHITAVMHACTHRLSCS